jgi:hypothetical protein
MSRSPAAFDPCAHLPLAAQAERLVVDTLMP